MKTLDTMNDQVFVSREFLHKAKEELLNICQISSRKIASYYHPRLLSNVTQSHVSLSKYSTKMNNTADLVTEVDQLIEQDIREYLTEKFPEFGFLGEECGYTKPINPSTNTIYWIVDPIDGTTNFVHQFPNSCISIGLAQQNSINITDNSSTTLLLGMIYHPISDIVYWAIINEGSFQQNLNNGQIFQLSVNKYVDNLKHALVCTEFGSYEFRYNTKSQESLTEQRTRLAHYPVHGIRCLGSAALNLVHVASGQVDIYYQYGIHAWDLAAGVLIVQEAGGVVSSLSNSLFDIFSRNVLACSTLELLKTFHEEIIDGTDTLGILKEFPRDEQPINKHQVIYL